MAKDFHEKYTTASVPLPSERSTGLVFTAVGIIIAYLWRENSTVMIVALSFAALLLTASLLAPSTLRPLNIVWFKLALLLNKLVSPVVMLLLFLAVIVPAGLIMQLMRDPLRKRRGQEIKSYWIERGPDWPAGSLTNQF